MNGDELRKVNIAPCDGASQRESLTLRTLSELRDRTLEALVAAPVLAPARVTCLSGHRRLSTVIRLNPRFEALAIIGGRAGGER